MRATRQLADASPVQWLQRTPLVDRFGDLPFR
jgi:hypothetical protein